MGDGGAGFDMTREESGLVLHARGDWLVATAADIDRALRRLAAVGAGERLRLDLGSIERLDTVGAWLVQRTARALTSRGVANSVENVPPAFAPLFEQVAKGEEPVPLAPIRRDLSAIIEAGLLYVGERTIEAGAAARDLVGFFGLIVVTWLRVLRRPGRMRWVALIAQMERTGVGALPIVGLLSFLIGVVLTFQGADQLRRFGAEIFAVNLLGIGLLRELTLRTDKLTVLVQILNKDYFVACAFLSSGVVSDAANGAGEKMGRARYLMRITAPRIEAEL